MNNILNKISNVKQRRTDGKNKQSDEDKENQNYLSNNKTSSKVPKSLKYKSKKNVVKKIDNLFEENVEKPNFSSSVNKNNFEYFTSAFDKNFYCNSPFSFKKGNDVNENENRDCNLISFDIEYSFSPNLLIKKMNTRNEDCTALSNSEILKERIDTFWKNPIKSGNIFTISKIFNPINLFDYGNKKNNDYMSFSNYLIKGRAEDDSKHDYPSLSKRLSNSDQKSLKASDLLNSSFISPFLDQGENKNKIFSIKKVRRNSGVCSFKNLKIMKKRFKNNMANLFHKVKGHPPEQSFNSKSIIKKSANKNFSSKLKLNSSILSLKSGKSSRVGMKYKMFTKEEKKFCLDLIMEGMSSYEVSKLCEVPLKSLLRWINVGIERKKGGGRKSMDPELEAKLMEWIERLTAKGRKPRPSEVRDKALQFTSCKNFKASKGWLEKFKKKNNIQLNQRVQTRENNMKEF